MLFFDAKRFGEVLNLDDEQDQKGVGLVRASTLIRTIMMHEKDRNSATRPSAALQLQVT